MGCCSKNSKRPKPGCKENRSCTDILCLLIFLIFVAAWVFVSIMAFKSGNLYWITSGVDYKGEICSIPSDKTPNSTALAAAGYGDTWTNRTLIWYPLDPTLLFASDLDVTTIITQVLKLGICVDRCPVASNSSSNPTMIKSPYGDGWEWTVKYDSTSPILNRCIPDITSPNTYPEVKKIVEAFSTITGIGDVWSYLEGELVIGLPILGIGLGTALVLCYLWIFFLKYTVGFFVYFVIILVFTIFSGGSAVLFWQAEEIKANAALDSTWRDWILPFQIFGGIAAFFAVIFFFLIMFMWRRIKIAIEILRIAADVMTSSPSVVLVPLLSTIFLGLVMLYSLFVGACIYAGGEITLEDISITIPFTNETATIETSYVSDNWNAKALFQVFNLFQFLWVMGLINAIAFMTIAFVTVMYYFSEPGNNKKAPKCATWTGLWWTLRYHLGTVAFGAFIIAVVQLIRVFAAYAQSKIEKSQNDAAKWVGRCIQCYLKYLERVITFINKNAYIICCIESTNFCFACVTAVQLLISNIADIAAANFIADAVFMFCKIAITGINVVIMWSLFSFTDLGEGAQVLAIPLVIGGLVTWIMAAIFMHVFDSVQDSALMCFVWDKENNNGTDEKPYYFNDAISGILDKFNYNKGETRQHESRANRKITPSDE